METGKKQLRRSNNVGTADEGRGETEKKRRGPSEERPESRRINRRLGGAEGN